MPRTILSLTRRDQPVPAEEIHGLTKITQMAHDFSKSRAPKPGLIIMLTEPQQLELKGASEPL